MIVGEIVYGDRKKRNQCLPLALHPTTNFSIRQALPRFPLLVKTLQYGVGLTALLFFPNKPSLSSLSLSSTYSFPLAHLSQPFFPLRFALIP